MLIYIPFEQWNMTVYDTERKINIIIFTALSFP